MVCNFSETLLSLETFFLTFKISDKDCCVSERDNEWSKINNFNFITFLTILIQNLLLLNDLELDAFSEDSSSFSSF